MEELMCVMVCGPTLNGKTTVARYLEKQIGFHTLDIDDLRKTCFGMPEMRPSRESHELHLRQFGATYPVFFLAVEKQLSVVRRSVIVTASLSSYEKGQVPLMEIAERAGATLKVIWVRADPSQMSDSEIEEMTRRRAREQGDYAGTLGTIHDTSFFRKVYATFEPIRIPGSVIIPTWPQYTVQESCEAALRYVEGGKDG